MIVAIGSERLLAAVPPDVYKRLPAARETLRSCVRTVVRAVMNRNSQLIEHWIDEKMSVPDGDDLLALIDAALDQAARDLRTCEDIRRIEGMRNVARTCIARRRGPSIASALDASLVTGLSLAIAMYDPALAAHSATVARLAQRVAVYTAMPRRQLETLVAAAQLHEIGRLRPAEAFSGSRSQLAAGGLRLRRTAGLEDVGAIVESLGEATWQTMSDEAQILDLADAFVTLTTATAHVPDVDPHDIVRAMRRDTSDRYNPLLLERFTDVLAAA